MSIAASYDSPTFLSQKDKYLFGLTLVQLVMLLAVGGFYFLLSFMLPLGSMITRLLVLVPAIGVTAVFMFVRISGLSVPMYVILWIMSMFKRPIYEDAQTTVLRGSDAWLKEQELKATRNRFGRRKAAAIAHTVDVEARKEELKAEMDKAVTEGAVSANQWVQDGVRTLMKGR